MVVVDRGRVFTDVVPQNVAPDPDQGKVTITIDRKTTDPEAAAVAPPEDGSAPVYQIDDSAALYVFDSRGVAEAGHYLGQFKVIGLGRDYPEPLTGFSFSNQLQRL